MAVAEAALGAVFGELLKTVLETIDKALKFKPTLVYLQSTLLAIAPVIEEIGRHSNKLGHPKEDLESLKRKMEEGTKLVCECSKIHRVDVVSRVRYQKQLEAFGNWLEKFFNINVQAQMARDQKEALIKLTRIYSAVNKLSTHGVGATSSNFDIPFSTQPAENASGTDQINIGDMDSSFVQEMKLIMTLVGPTITVIGPKYCCAFPIMLEIVRTVKKFGFSDKFMVKNAHNNIIFNLERPSFSIHERCILFDDDNNPVVTMHSRRMTAHNRWQVYRGTSDQTHDLLFNVKQHHIVQLKTKLDVFLATNTEEKDCDFTVEGSWTGGSYVVSAVQSKSIIAQISKYIAPRRIGSSTESVVVKVKANVDSAFIVALIIVILSLT